MARREVVASCGLIGALGGALFGYAIMRPHYTYRGSWDFVLALTVCTAISGTLLGLFLRTERADAHAAGMRATWLSFVFGGLNGALMILAMSFLKGAPRGGDAIFIIGFAAIFGGVCSIPFIPAIAAVAVMATKVDGRPNTIVEGAQRRRVLRVALMSLAIAAAFVPRSERVPFHLHLPMVVIGVAVVSTVILIVIDLFALDALRGSSIDGDLEPASREVVPDIDFGVGGERLMVRAYDSTYRADVVPSVVVYGSRAEALARVEKTLRGHAIALGVTVAALALQLPW
jgi:hypothetical protein